MQNTEKNDEKNPSSTNQSAEGNKKPEPSVAEQIRREFEYSEDHGEPEIEQIGNELSEEKYMLPSPENSREDAAFANITADEKGLAYGIANQRNESLDVLDKVEDRDEDRWELNPASADSTKE